MTGFVFDHVSLGVRDAEASLRALRRRIGLTPLAGERLPRYRYVLNRVGDARTGMQLELIEEQGGPSSFMHRFLARHGEGVHHVTFTVPDLERTVAEVRRAGFPVVRVDLHYPPWREAFIMPTEPALGVVVQIADSSLRYPAMPEFLEAESLDPESIPHNDGGSDRAWWREARDAIAPGPLAHLRRVDWDSRDPLRLLELLTGPLGGNGADGGDGGEVVWGASRIGVATAGPGAESGIRRLAYTGGSDAGFSIGTARFVREPDGAEGTGEG